MLLGFVLSSFTLFCVYHGYGYCKQKLIPSSDRLVIEYES